jgi:1,4-dihydroxy-2-naphthoate octaprenyltransferase
MARGWGEAVVALLFGPATVLAGWYCGATRLPSAVVCLLGAALGLLTANVLAVNEVPDAAGDARVGKRTLVVRLGAARGWLLQSLLCAAAVALLAAAAWLQRPANFGLVVAALLTAWLGCAMALRLRRHCADKPALVAASRLAAALQGAVALLIVVDGLRGSAT